MQFIEFLSHKHQFYFHIKLVTKIFCERSKQWNSCCKNFINTLWKILRKGLALTSNLIALNLNNCFAFKKKLEFPILSGFLCDNIVAH